MSDTERRLADIEKRLDESSAYALTVACARMQRRLEDIEKRLARLESLERRAPMTFGPAPKHESQWCECGRDGCRWPYCKSHVGGYAGDPLGR